MNYYNEIDSFAVKWLRNLIEAGLIPRGDVDDRSIVDVRGDDIRGYEQCHFFAGIGGWAYALQLAGWEGEAWTGSCPCQPFSVAGAGKGTDDERHLWPAFRRLISECRPPVVFGEQVASKDGRLWLAGVRADLEACGYGVGAADLAAASVGAPHIRQRLYWLADRDGGRREQRDAGEWRLPKPEPHGAAIGLAESNGGECGRLSEGEGRHAGAPSGWTRDHQLAGGGTSRGLADDDHDGPHRTGGVAAVTGSDWQDGGLHRGSAGRVGHTAGTGSQTERASGTLSGCHAHRPGAWASCTTIECGDGKSRRIPAEPSFFPLVDGLSPGRVGILRGAGNAIVPQVAAEFVAAYMDVLHA